VTVRRRQKRQLVCGRLNRVWRKSPSTGYAYFNFEVFVQNFQETFTKVLLRILKPLARIALQHSISYGPFSEVVKQAFVQAAYEDFSIKNRKQTISRVAVLTGLTRKVVKRLKEGTEAPGHQLARRYNRAARVIAGWRRDPAFLTRRGEPADLPFAGGDEEVSFSMLAKYYSGDIHPRTILDELLRIETVTKLADGRIRLRDKIYLPHGDKEMKLNILGTDVAYLINTIGHNLEAEPPDAFVQRKVLYDNLPAENLAAVRQHVGLNAQKLTDHLDKYLSGLDRDTNPDVDGSGRYTAGVGIYYFEEMTDEAIADE
jgi:hypothetical protein